MKINGLQVQNHQPVSQMSEAFVAKFDNGWRTYWDKDTNRWVAECSRGSRPRKRFIKKQSALDHAALQSRIQSDRNAPIMKAEKENLTLIQTLAAKLEDASPEDFAALQILITAKPDALRALGQIAPSLIQASEKHKAATLVIASLQKLHPSRSHWTVEQMVDERIVDKKKRIEKLPTQERRAKARGHLLQVTEVGEVLKKKLGGATDIDSITRERMVAVIGEYAAENGHSDATKAARMNIAAQFFNHAAKNGWQGKSPCHFVEGERKSPAVALTFEEAAGVMIALVYTNPHAAFRWSLELFSLLRGEEARGVRQVDILLDDMRLLATPKASSEHGKAGSGTVDDDQTQRSVEIVDQQYQWIRFLWCDEYANGWTMTASPYQDAIAHAREISGCARWGKKGTGRHTGRNVLRKWSIPKWKIQEQMGHADNSRVTDRNYNARLTHEDAGAMLLITPYFLGLIAEPYAYRVPKGHVLHLGHTLKLDETHQHIIDKYLPKLREIHERIKAKLGIK